MMGLFSWFSNKETNQPEQPKKVARRRSNLSKRFKKDEFINILLLGGTGVGKSTFINSFANYLVYGDYDNAEKSELLKLIQMKIAIGTEEFVIGQDENEDETTGASSTQNVKSYTFPLKEWGVKLRLIDTPGLADVRGLDQDEANCEFILEYIASMENLHAICILMRAGIDRISVEFEYCIRQILTRLEKSATQNIIFVITNTSGRNYTGGETVKCLKKFVSDIKLSSPHIDIPVDEKRNIFCVDNEGFKYLVGQKNDIVIPGDKSKFIESWRRSSLSCWRLIGYILGDEDSEPLKPHKVQNSVSINEARRVVVLLQQPLTEITQIVSTNVDLLEKQEAKLRDENQSLDDLKNNMYIPHINFKSIELTQPVTVCASAECAHIIEIEGREIWNYPNKCHEPCYLDNVQREIIGDSNLINCYAMKGSNCRFCSCSYKDHMHIYYETKIFDDNLQDQNAVASISTKEEALAAAKIKIEEILERKNQFEKEHGFIVNTMAQFIHFLQTNAITPFDDSVKAHLKHLIRREHSRGARKNQKTIESLEKLLKRHEQEKAAYDNAVAGIKNQDGFSTPTSPVTPNTIFESIQHLFSLNHYGDKIKDVYEKQKKCIQHEQKNRPVDYTHAKPISTTRATGQEQLSLIFINY